MEADVSAIRARIEVVENRLTALADHGVDTAGLRSRLTQARDLLETGEPTDALTLTDEVAVGVRQLATGAARSSGEIRNTVRDQLVGEVRYALAGGAAHDVLEQRLNTLRTELDGRLTHFERHLRDQFARELAQVVAARPWMKDVLSHPGDPTVLRTAIEAVLSEQRPAPAADAPLRGGVDGLRDQVSGLRRRVELALGAAAPEDRLQQALAAIAASEEGMTDLVANIAEMQAQMGDRVILLERRLAEMATQQAAALTRLTALHIDPGIAPESGAPTVGSTAAVAEEVATLPPPTGSKAWPFGDESSLSAPAISTDDVAALMRASTADVPVASDRAEARPSASALTSGDTALMSPGDGSTAGMSMTPQQVTTDIRRSARRAIDESVVRRLIEERLAAWQPSAGEGLVQDEDDQLAQLIHLLPKALDEGTVRTALFATLALEAIEKPGALAHLTRLRAFLREELGLAAEQLRSDAAVST